VRVWEGRNMSYFIFSVSCVLSVCLVYEGADVSQGKEVMRRGSDVWDGRFVAVAATATDRVMTSP
jgi:hypothetical protein